MLTETSDISNDTSEIRFLTEEEDLAMKEKLAQKRFGMSLDQFREAWQSGQFDDDEEKHNEVVSLAMMLPEYWTD